MNDKRGAQGVDPARLDAPASGGDDDGALVALLEELSSATGVSGHEEPMAERVARWWQPWVDDVRRDRLGNCIARRAPRVAGGAGEGRPMRVLLAAHMDEIGLMVMRIEKGGFLRVTPVGGVSVHSLIGHPVTVHARAGALPGVVGFKPPHLTQDDEWHTFPDWSHLFVDTGLPEETVRHQVAVGDPITLAVQPRRLAGEHFGGKALDNRASVAALWEALRHLAGLWHAAEVFAVATVQEEVGLRGAMVSAFGLLPDIGIAVDVGHARQRGVGDPDALEQGKGPSIAMGANIHPRIHQRLVETAKKHQVTHQLEAIPGRSGTDAWAIQVTRAGIPTGLVSIPLRYMHSPVEVVHLGDIRQTGRLLAHFVASINAAFVQGLSEWGVAV